MTQFATVVAACIVLFFATGRVQAQDAPPAPDGEDTTAVAVSDKSPVTAGVLEWFVPTLGYAYAGNWSRGIPPALVRVTGVILIFSQQFVLFDEPPPCRGECLAGVALLLGGTVWAIVDAGNTATRQNARRRASLLGGTVVPTFGPAGPVISFSLSVGH